MKRMGPLLLVGGGKMGIALLKGWLARGLAPENAFVIEPNPQAEIHAIEGITTVGDVDALPNVRPAVVVLAVKPQVMDGALPAYRRFVDSATVFLSIAAGKTIAGLTSYLGEDVSLVRAMPNTPAAVGRGITVLCANRLVSPVQREVCGQLMAAVGEVAWIDDEGQMDAVTGVSGSGPAYVFLLVEALAAAGRAEGLPEGLAMRLARATVAGSGALLHEVDEDAAQLRVNVTSPAGTTAAALDVLMGEDGLTPLLERAVRAAAARSRELAG
ncbi:MAG: pyrroline-5-carboxylate reductase [Alphaproteobacteria bacterium]